MSLLAKLSTLVKAGANDAVDKAIDHNSIPVVKQEIRDIEIKQSEVTHFAAAADANVTILTEQVSKLQTTIDHNIAEAKTAKASGDITTAKTYVQKVVDENAQLATLNTQLANAKVNAQHMNEAAESLTTRHNSLISTLRSLESEDQSARALEQANAGLKQVQNLTSSVDGPNMDNLADRIHARNVTAQTEFNRTSAGFTHDATPDPLKDEAAEELLAAL